ncbi:UDP-N-acetylmuramoyl-tripeptide--D-alanyl-D-alanine ligase [Thiohalorhabdus sp.]|uniref:UDP-N-acetylmuramoyl-tripeptide--D-alanyl-D- alanine ligase n=1 Tax=Thiohalorhabdus sp. TaxID=3094134 RepID=UPI002FC3B4B6
MMTLAEVAAWTGGQCHGEARLRGVATDTRRLEPGTLFVALKGPRHDGHAFLAEAAEAGAAGVLVEAGQGADLPRVEVADTGRALLDLAREWRLRSPTRVVAVTGSCGKTTVKDLIAAVLSVQAPEAFLATPGNWNNTVGMPLTLLGLEEYHRYAAVEVGINECGEMALLADTAAPDVAVITNAAPAHLEGLGSLEAVAAEKARLLGGLGPDGVAVINADSSFADQWVAAAPGRVVRFGLEAAADIRGEWQPEAGGGRLWVATPDGEVELALALPGRHNAVNALAALAAAYALGIAPERAAAGMEAVAPTAGRLQIRSGPGGLVVLDDTYNANPESLVAALDVLTQQGGHTWAVLGDMGELGDESAAWHAEAGLAARQRRVDRLIAVGRLAANAAEAFGTGGCIAANWQEAAAVLAHEAAGGDRVLIKGSRSMGLERLVAQLMDQPGEKGACG